MSNPVSAPSPMGGQAIELVRKGLYIVPLCWPDAQGKCACGNNHSGHNIGKAPLTRKGINDSSDQIKQVWEWWTKWPGANVAVDLDRSGLIAIGPDSVEWHEKFIEAGLPETYTIRSGGGDGHFHYYYRRPEGTPLINSNLPDKYDIQPRGYVVGEGSLHQSGKNYSQISTFPWRDVEDLPFAPEWAVESIKERWANSAHNAPVEIDYQDASVPTNLVTGGIQEWWDGSKTAAGFNGEADRSKTLFVIGLLLAKQGATAPEIVAALHDRDEALGYHKYSRRRGAGQKEYARIAAVVLASREMTTNGVDAAESKTKTPQVPQPLPSYLEGNLTCNSLHVKDHLVRSKRSKKSGLKLLWIWHAGGHGNNAAKSLINTAERKYTEFLTLGRQGKELCILHVNPSCLMPKEEALSIFELSVGSIGLDGQEMPVYSQFKDCGEMFHQVCPDRHESQAFPRDCRTHFCPHCTTEKGEELAKATLPQLETEGSNYVAMVVGNRYELPDGDYTKVGDICQREYQRWIKLVRQAQEGRLSWARSFKGKVLFRSIMFYVGVNEVQVRYNLMYQESDGEGEALMTELCDRLDGWEEGVNRYQDSEHTVLQLVEFARSYFAGMSTDLGTRSKVEAFFSMYMAMKGAQVFQGLGLLKKLMEAAEKPKPELSTCKHVVDDDSGAVCGLPVVTVRDVRGNPSALGMPLDRGQGQLGILTDKHDRG